MDNVQSKTNTSSTYITKLTNDILWTIFQIHTDVFNDETPIQNLQNTSQVCRAWREIVINSPSLWGQVIDLNELLREHQTSSPTATGEVVPYSKKDGYLDGHPWLKEILRRSGTSTLCIRADYIVGTENILLALRFIDNEWTRIRKLALILGDRDDEIDLTNWNPLSRWAPSLEFLILSIINYRRDPSTIDPAPSDDNVPALVDLVAGRLVNLQPHLPWLGHLRSLCIRYPLSVPDILKIVDKLCSVQTLQVHGVQTFQGSDTSFPTIYPPGLKHLTFTATELQTASILLNHIQLPSDCSLDIHVWTGLHNLTEDDAASETMKTALRPFANHARQLYKVHPPISVKIGQFQDSGSPPYEFQTQSAHELTYFKFSLAMRESFFKSLFSAFSFPELASVTHLFFHSFPVPDTAAKLFLPLLSNVTTLDANESAFINFFNPKFIENFKLGRPMTTDTADISNILPLLSTLRIKLLEASAIVGPEALCTLLRDLLKKGRPIKVLDLTKNSLSMAPDLSMLEEVQGLKVVWKDYNDDIQEYICGSGEPHKLPYGLGARSPFADGIASLFRRRQSQATPQPFITM